MTTEHEQSQQGSEAPLLTSPLPGQIHWTAKVSFGCGLFLVALSAFGAVLNESTPMGRSFWDSVSRMYLGPVFSAVILTGILYALIGWIFGLVAFVIARRPAWSKGFALACVGLAISVIFCVVLVVTIIGFFVGLSARFGRPTLFPSPDVLKRPFTLFKGAPVRSYSWAAGRGRVNERRS